MGDVVVRVAGPTGEAAATLTVRLGTRGRRRLRPGRGSGSGSTRADRSTLVAGDRGGEGSAWTVASASAAARRRWSGGHPAVATVVDVWVREPAARPAVVSELLERARAELVARGVRRVDLLTTPTDPVLGPLRAAGWFAGVVGGHVVASWCITPTWRDLVDEATTTHARHRGRLRRRLAGVRPRDLPALAATVAAEARGRAAERRRPAATSALAEQPPGSVHHEPTRYRTVRRALELVPAGFRSERLLDVGCGDGRVLDVARSLGFTDLAGVEHDPGLVDAARRRLATSATVDLGDARTTPIDDRIGVVYLFNPFDEAAAADVARAVRASLERRPRPLLVVYVNPRAVAPLLDVGLTMVHLEPQFCVLAT